MNVNNIAWSDPAEIADCRKAGLPEPDFEQRGPHFVVTLWRDWLTAEVMDHLELNDRQMLGVETL